MNVKIQELMDRYNMKQYFNTYQDSGYEMSAGLIHRKSDSETSVELKHTKATPKNRFLLTQIDSKA